MTKVKSKTGREYEVGVKLYGTSNRVYQLFLGGVFLAQSGSRGLNAGPDKTIEDAIQEAAARAEALGLTA